jgi:hypothetical protein
MNITNARFWNAPVTAGVPNFSYAELLEQLQQDLAIGGIVKQLIYKQDGAEYELDNAVIPLDNTIPQNDEGVLIPINVCFNEASA